MFNQLIESGSHKKDRARRGRFFLGTLGFYSLLLMVAGVASVYAYDSHLSTQNLELYTLVAPPPVAVETRRPDEPKPASGGQQSNEIAQRKAAIAPLLSNTHPPETISTERNTLAEMPKNRAFVVSDRDYDPAESTGGIKMPGAGYVPDTDRNAVVVAVDQAGEVPPPRPSPTPAPVKPPDKVRLSTSVIASKIITKPAPAYPTIAKQTGVQGTVTVEILIDEEGRVVSARATGGHPLLRAAAQSSAFHARFSPTFISSRPVKVTGIITYNFILQ